MHDTFAYWRNALKGQFGPVHENDPQAGFYRTRPAPGERASAIAIWHEEGKRLGLRDGVPVDPARVWTWCCMHPVTYAHYVAVAERGERWPDEPPAIGHNSARQVTPASLASDTDALWDSAHEWLELPTDIVTQEKADLAANLVDYFVQLADAAQAALEAEKAPLLLEAKAVETRWKPLVERLRQGQRKIKERIEAYLIAEWNRLSPDGGYTAPEAPPRAGTFGRTIALRRRREVEVRNEPLFSRHYRRDPRLVADEGVRKVMTRLAHQDLTAGRMVPGAVLIERKSAV